MDNALKLASAGRTKKDGENDWTLAVLFGIVVVFFVVATHVLSRDSEFDHRVSADKLTANEPITTALRASQAELPTDVSELHCYFRPWGGGGEHGMAHVQCDVTLRGRAVQDMGMNQTVWLDDVYANPNEPGHPLHGFNRDTDTMLATDFNFVINRGNDGVLTVLSNVDENRLSYAEASGIVIATAQVFRDAMTKELSDAACNSPASIKSTWKH